MLANDEAFLILATILQSFLLYMESEQDLYL